MGRWPTRIVNEHTGGTKGVHVSAVLLRRKFRKFGEPALRERVAS